MSQENSKKKKTSVESVLIGVLKDSANQTNKRIDDLANHIGELADQTGKLIEAGIRREERDEKHADTVSRLGDGLTDLSKELKDYMKDSDNRLKDYIKDNDNRSAENEKQIFLLKIDYEHSKEEKEKKEKNTNIRKNSVIAALIIIAIVATFQALAPFIGK